MVYQCLTRCMTCFGTYATISCLLVITGLQMQLFFFASSGHYHFTSSFPPRRKSKGNSLFWGMTRNLSFSLTAHWPELSHVAQLQLGGLKCFLRWKTSVHLVSFISWILVGKTSRVCYSTSHRIITVVFKENISQTIYQDSH